jgi:hypothetical protein
MEILIRNENYARERMVRIVDELTDIFQSLEAPSSESLGLLDEDQSKVAVLIGTAFGWTNKVLRSGLLALLAKKNGFAAECGPLVRACVEHSVSVHWLATDGVKALDVLFGSRTRSVQKLKDAQSVGWNFDSAEIQSYLSEFSLDTRTDEERANDFMSHFKEVAHKLGMGEEYQSWLISTFSSHATLSSANFYYGYSPENGYVLNYSPMDNHIEIEAQIAIATLNAVSGYLKFVNRNDLLKQISDYSGELNSLSSQI